MEGYQELKREFKGVCTFGKNREGEKRFSERNGGEACGVTSTKGIGGADQGDSRRKIRKERRGKMVNLRVEIGTVSLEDVSETPDNEKGPRKD